MGRIQETHDVESNEDKGSAGWREWIRVITWSIFGYFFLILIVVSYVNPALLPIDPIALVFNTQLTPFFAFSDGPGYFPKPYGFQIIALVPFNDFERTEILDCYLQVLNDPIGRKDVRD